MLSSSGIRDVRYQIADIEVFKIVFGEEGLK